MFDPPEKPVNPKNAEWEIKEDFARRARNSTIKELIKPEEIPHEQILQLAYRALTYDLEISFYEGQKVALLDPQDRLYDSDSMSEFWREAILKTETALHEAAIGNLEPLKEDFKYSSPGMVDSIKDLTEFGVPNGETEKDSEADKKWDGLINRLIDRTKSLPDTKPKSWPPLERVTPAFQDPRFNGENDFLEIHKD